jgi:hypothetical protein
MPGHFFVDGAFFFPMSAGGVQDGQTYQSLDEEMMNEIAANSQFSSILHGEEV